MSANILTLHPFLTVTGVPESARPLLARLLSEPALPLPTMVRCVGTYRLVIEAAAIRNGRANVALGRAIAASLTTFLARIDYRLPKAQMKVVQAAVRYFVIEDDGFGHDLEHEDGLIQDACVVNAMLRWFGCDDLCVRLPPSQSERRKSAQLQVASMRAFA